MEKDQLEQIKHLVGLFEKRDLVYQRVTEKIFDAVGPTVLEALTELFAVDHENVAWIEAQLIGDMFVVMASVTYDDGQEIPAVIQALSPSPEDKQASVRLFRVGIPFSVLFLTKDDVIKFLTNTAKLAAQDVVPVAEALVAPEKVSAPVEFNTQELTQDQVQQMLVFGLQTMDTKH